MRKRRIGEVLLCMAFIACTLFGGASLKMEKTEAAGLPTEMERATPSSTSHSVTFIVDGEVYAFLEWIPDNTALGEAMIEDVALSGYDFLGWTYGDGQLFTKDTPITTDMVVTARLVERPYREDELASYITLQNLDFGAPVSLTHTEDNLGSYIIHTENNTTSMVYKFEYVDNGDGELWLSLRDIFGGNGERGYAFLFDGKMVQTPIGNITLDEGEKYVIEIGAIDALSGGKTNVFVKVNGEVKLDGRVPTKLNTGNVLLFGGSRGATSAFMQVNAYLVGGNHYETLDEAAKAADEEVRLIRDVEEVLLSEGTITLNLNGNNVGDVLVEGGRLTLYGGNVLGDIILSKGELTVKEGSFATDVGAYLADGYHCIEQEKKYFVGKHEKVRLEGYAATCTKDGLTDGERCSICDKTLVPQEIIPSLGHQEKVLEGVPATCQTQGRTEGSQCSVCGEIIVPQESTPTTAHLFEEGACKYCGKAEQVDGADALSSPVDTSSSTAQSEEEIDETLSDRQEEGCAGSAGSFFGWLLIVAAMVGFRRKKDEE